MGALFSSLRKLKRKLNQLFQREGRAPGLLPFEPPEQPPSVPVTATLAVPTRPVPYTHIPLYTANNINELTQFPNWDWLHFRSVLVTLAMTGPGIYIPDHRRPHSIFLDGLQATLNEMQDLAHRHPGREISRRLYVDRERKSLVISGKTSIGAQDHTTITISREADVERYQQAVLTIYTLPEIEPVYGSSKVDYVSFLTDLRQIAMIISWKYGVILLLKTTATPYGLRREVVQKQVSAMRGEYLECSQPRFDPQFSLFCFNRALCSAYGLTYFEATPDSLLARQIKLND